jgi:2-amino-4-hydroxy-6-hydroxymethyldihydropteridine diphosphokinase
MLEPLARVEAVSALYESPPQPPAPPPAYLNAACRVVTGLTPLLLLRHLKRIEGLIGRHDLVGWSPRPIDLDIVLFNDEVIDSSDLAIPHPRMLERAFVLQPLLDLNSDLVHPVSGTRLDDDLRQLDGQGLVTVAPPGWHIT